MIAGPGFENFIPVTVITELFIHLAAGAGDEDLERMDEAVSRILQDKPFFAGDWQLQGSEGTLEAAA
ncbi:hypothetical protein ACFTAO_05330 [Paenibacillus rhizoplanae]